MNKARRKKINEIMQAIEGLKSNLESLSSDLDDVYDEEEDYLGNIPENLQYSERYGKSQAAVDNLGEASNFLEIATSHLDDAISSLVDAME